MSERTAPVRTISPLAGLHRRSLAELEVTAQSVGTAAPAAAMSSVPALVAAVAGNATMYSFLVATVVVVLVAYCINQFARRMAASGSLYTFVARGLGPTPAMLCGVGLILGYGVLAMSTLVLSSSYLLAGAGSITRAVAVMALLAAVAACAMTRGVALSSRVMLGLEAAAICAVVVVVAVLAVRVGTPFDARLLRADHASLDGMGTGVALAITAFIGFESAAALGPEARRPYRSVTRAISRTVAGAAMLYAAGAWVQLTDFRDGANGLAASATPLPDLAVRAGAGWLSGALDVAIAASSFACATASATALTRLLFSMARERLLPSPLGRTSISFRTPHVAILVSWLLILAVPGAMVAAGVSLAGAFRSLVTVATFGYMLAYILVCWALPRFLHRIGELTRTTAAAGSAAALVLTAVFVAYALPMSTRAQRQLLLLSCCLVVAAMAALLARVRLRPESPRRIGLYDEPIASDLLEVPWRRAS